MRNFKDIILEKLKVSANGGVVRIKTTLRKFMAWYIGKDEWRINRYDIEERNFISSDKSMSIGDKNDFLYKHMNDIIYISEEEKLTRGEIGLSGMTKSKLYDYLFEIEGITFSIDARIYDDDELLSSNRQYIITEKLKVTKDFNTTRFETKLDDFIKAYFMIEPRYALYSNEAYFRIIDGYEDDPMDGSNDDIFLNTIIKYFDKSFHKFQNWIYKYNGCIIDVHETVLEYDSGPYSIEVKYEFDLDNKHLEFLAYFTKEEELYSNILQ